MAITLQQSPAAYAPANNPIALSALSDNLLEDNFSYLLEVYVDGSRVLFDRVDPNPEFGTMVRDVSEIVRSELAADFLPLASGFVECPNVLRTIQVRIGERYDVAGEVTDFLNLANASFYAFDGALDPFTFYTFDHTDYLIGSASKKFLTNAPEFQYVQATDRAYLYYIDATLQAGRLAVKSYNIAGSLLDTDFIATGTAARCMKVGVGPADITEELGDAGAWLTSVAYYTVEVQTAGGTQLTEARRYDLQTVCQYTPVRLHFMNRLGGFDAYNFTKVSRETFEHTIQTYQRSAGVPGASSYTFSASDALEPVYMAESQPFLSVGSDWLSDEEYAWLLELTSSPIVYAEYEGQVFAVRPEEKRFTKLRGRVDGLKRMELTLRFAQTHVLQSV